MILVVFFSGAFACFLRDRLILPGAILFVLGYFLLVGASIASDISELQGKLIGGFVVVGFIFVFSIRRRRKPPRQQNGDQRTHRLRAVKDRDEGKLIFRCHMHREAKSPRGEPYRVSIDRRGILLGNGRIAFLTLPLGWILHRSRWPDQWWLTVGRQPHRQDFLHWRLTNIWSYGPYNGEAKAREELERLVDLIAVGGWYEGKLVEPPSSDA